MDQCRICLKFEADKDIYDIKLRKKMNTQSFAEIISFCLDIKITVEQSVSTKLCIKCHRKIVAFNKFKILALKNDTYLKSLKLDCKNEKDISDNEKNITNNEEDISNNEEAISNNEVEIKVENLSLRIKAEDNEDFELNNEGQPQEYESDNEALSVIRNTKYEFCVDETEEHDSVKEDSGKKRKVKSSSTKLSKPTCDECGKSVSNLKDHMQLHLPDDKRRSIPCDRCDKTFSTYGAKYKHVQRKHLSIKRHCQICDKKVLYLKQHILLKHDPERLPHQCFECERKFISKSNLENHMMIHTKDRPYACSQCDKRFQRKGFMQLHVRQVHNKEKSYLCQFCSKSFSQKHNLQVHLRSHTKEKPYSCSDCGKSFSSCTTLKNHRMIHSGVKPFVCTICNMTFARSAYLKSHMVSHIRDKKFPCRYCGVKFLRTDHRKRHEYTAHLRHFNGTADT